MVMATQKMMDERVAMLETAVFKLEKFISSGEP